MSHLTGPEAARVFQENYATISNESDRGAVLVSAALIDEGLRRLIAARLLENSSQSDPLFDGGNAPISTFSSRIEMAYRLGLIQCSAKSVLNKLRRLRNDFAHSHKIVSLEDPSVKDRIEAMLAEQREITDALRDTSMKVIEETLKESGINDTDPKQFYDENWTIRETFNAFFAVTSMSISRIIADVDHLESLNAN